MRTPALSNLSSMTQLLRQLCCASLFLASLFLLILRVGGATVLVLDGFVTGANRGGDMALRKLPTDLGIQLNSTAMSSNENLTRVTAGALVNERGISLGCVWGDYNNDGFVDLFVANFGGGNFLYRNNGDGTFTKITNGIVVTDNASSEGCAWGDYDNDGLLDLFVANRNGQNNFLYHNNGDGTFAKITSGIIVNDGGDSLSCVWGDYNNDGHLDLFVANLTGSNFLYRNNGNGTFTKITSGDIVTDARNTVGCAWGDYDNDGFIDLFVANGGGNNNVLYHNNGNGSFTKITAGNIVNDGGYSVGCAWGDYDNDGFLDLFVANRLGNNFLYHNNGDGTFIKITTGNIVLDRGESNGCAWGDYDNDGFLDLFVTNWEGRNNFLYHNNGNGTFTRITTGSLANEGGSSVACGWADYQNDGFLDLFVSNSGKQNNYLYRNEGNSNSWITIKCLGTSSNRSAIGAKVRVRALIGGTTRWQMREIFSGDGWNGQSLVAQFGLGDASVIDTVRIEWPSGTVQEIRNVPARQTLTVREQAPPIIISQPASQTARPGATVTFSVSARGTPPLGYQWRFNTRNIPNATNLTLVLTNAQLVDAGMYSVAVSNATGSAISAFATLTINPQNTPPTISDIPNWSALPGRPTSPIPFTIGDAETASESLTVRARSSNPGLVPNANIFLGGSGASRAVILQLAPFQSGQTTITITVTDPDGASTSKSFTVTAAVGQPVFNDFNGDGLADIIFQNPDGYLGVWFMEGPNLVFASLFNPANVGDKNWRLVGTGDFTGSFRADLLFQHADGSLAVWFMDGINLIAPALLNPSRPADRNYRVAGTGDFNRDGKVDLVFQHRDGPIAVWYMRGTNLLSGAINPINPGAGWKVVGVADFNRDGNADLLFQHDAGGLAVWYLEGFNLNQSVAINPTHPDDVRWRVAGTVDLNRDGKADLLFQHSVDHSVGVWFMDGINLLHGQLLNPSNPGDGWTIAAP